MVEWRGRMTALRRAKSTRALSADGGSGQRASLRSSTINVFQREHVQRMRLASCSVCHRHPSVSQPSHLDTMFLLMRAEAHGATISDIDDPHGGLRITFGPRQRQAHQRMLGTLTRLVKCKRAVRIAATCFTVRCPRCGRGGYRLVVV